MKSPRTMVRALLILAGGLAPLWAGAAAALPDSAMPDEVQERQVERRVWHDGDGERRVVEIEHDGANVSGNLMVISSDGSGPVHMELEADGEGGFHWVQRDADGAVIERRSLDEIVEHGDPRVRAVFIGEHAEPVKLACDAEAGEDCDGFNFAYRLLPEVFDVGRGYLGVATTELTPELRAHFGAPDDAGVLVARVSEDSPAALAGIQVGDVITSLDGEAVDSQLALRRRVRTFEEGDTATVEIVRGHRALAFDVTVAERAVPEVDVNTFFLRPQLGEGDGPKVYNLDPSGIEDHLVRIQERLGSPELRRDVIRVRGVESELEKRIEQLEKQLEELSKALEEDG